MSILEHVRRLNETPVEDRGLDWRILAVMTRVACHLEVSQSSFEDMAREAALIRRERDDALAEQARLRAILESLSE